jgi:hypothetical protein
MPAAGAGALVSAVVARETQQRTVRVLARACHRARLL